MLPNLAWGDEEDFLIREIKSTADGTLQTVRYSLPPQAKLEPRPLLVVLHTWQGNFDQEGFIETCQEECAARDWVLVHPDFRGSNNKPEACASPLAVQDVLDAVREMQRIAKIDPKRIYLVGTSGGGHMSLVMAARAPNLWAGVSAWVPVTDLAAWHEHTARHVAKYARDVEKCCGGKPGDSKEVDFQYRERSPVHLLTSAKGVPIDINAGITDGHTGSVPVSHTLWAFNVLAEANGEPDRKLTAEEIQIFTDQQKVPDELRTERAADPRRQHQILFRRTASSARVTIFDGGHEGDMSCAIRFLADQKRP